MAKDEMTGLPSNMILYYINVETADAANGMGMAEGGGGICSVKDIKRGAKKGRKQKIGSIKRK
jgi:hypothetical protein